MADLRGMGLPQGAAHDGKILSEEVDEVSVDFPGSGHDPVPIEFFPV